MANLNQNPYYDDHETQFYEKNYKEVLFNPGRAVQARELTQAQSFVYDQLKENFKTIYKNGSIINGLNVVINGTTAYLTAGEFYYEGRVYNVPAQSVTITGTGTENLGLKLVEEFVTSTDDNALLDPANGYTNYGNPGADRLKQTWQFVKDDPDMLNLWTVIDGQLQPSIKTDPYKDLMNILAKRTYDESGNYLVRGMTISVEDNKEDVNKIDYVIDAGTAYVKGYEVTLPSPKRIVVPKSQNYSSRKNEPKTYSSGTYKYKLLEPYVKAITEVNAQVQTTIYVTKGTANGQDTFTANSDSNNPPSIQGTTFTNIISIDEITSSDGSTIYQNGADYVLTNDTIDWSPGGSEPTTGDTYKVKFTYSKTYDVNNDITLVQDSEDDSVYYLEFNANLDDSSYPQYTNYPVDNSVFYVDYDYYLARTDLISVNYKGEFIVKQGQYTEYNETIIPQTSQDVLQLGYVKLMPNRGASEAKPVNFDFKRTTMMDLFYALKRIQDLEYNQAELALEFEAEKEEVPTTLRGILVDNFEDISKADNEATDFYCSISDIDNALTLAVNYEMNSFDTNNNVLTNIDDYSDDPEPVYALKKTGEYVLVENDKKTHFENLNPYTFLDEARGYVILNPRRDYWVEDEFIQKYQIQRRYYYRWMRTRTWGQWWQGRRLAKTYCYHCYITTEETITNKLINSRYKGQKYVTYARQINVQIVGKEWKPFTKVMCFFDDIPISLSAPAGSTWDGSNQTQVWDTYNYNGTDYNVAIVQGDGTFSAQFTIPEGTKTGKHVVKLHNVDTNYNYQTIFESTGIQRIYENLILRTITDRTLRIYPPWDPIAQSFVFDKDVVLTGIDVYFYSKDDNIPAFCQIGYLENGYPSTNSVFHVQYIHGSEVSTSTNGSVATRINFTKPIYIPANKPFFISFGSASNQWNIFVAEMGKPDLASGKMVTKNAYLDGVLFKSSNNNTWTAFQTVDLAFKLYAGTFETSGTITTENMSIPNKLSMFNYFSDKNLMENTEIIYYYSVDGGTTWKLFEPENLTELGGEYDQLKFKFELKGDGKNTPIFYKASNKVLCSKYDITKDNYYLTKTVTGVPAYNDVKIIFDTIIPSGTQYELYISPDDALWLQVPETDKISETVYDATLPKYNRIYEFSFDKLWKVDVTSYTGTPTVGATISSSTGTGSPAGTLLAFSSNYAIFEITSGSLTDGETLTMSDSSTIQINNSHNMVDNTVFKGKIKLISDNSYTTPVIQKLKYIMKYV